MFFLPLRFSSAFLRSVCAGNGEKSNADEKRGANKENLFVIETKKSKKGNEKRNDKTKQKDNSPPMKCDSCERRDQTKTVTLPFDPNQSVLFSSLFTLIFYVRENVKKTATNYDLFPCLSLQVIPSDHNLHQNDAQLQANGQGEDYQYQGPAGPLEFVIALSIFGRHFPGFSIYSVFSYSCHI